MSNFPVTLIRRSHVLGSLALLITLGGCAGAIANEPVHRAGPDLRGYYGTGTLTPAQLALGGPTGVAPGHTREQPDLDAYLKPSERAQSSQQLARAQTVRAKPRVAKPAAVPIVATQPQPSQPTLLADATPTPAAPVAANLPADAERYAARQAQSSKQQQYRGGDVVVISVSTILIGLLIVILILLLT